MKKIIILIIGIGLYACQNEPHQKLTDEEYFALSEEQRRSPEYALEGLDLYDPELEVTLFASEPMMINPTNMDIDDRGRVWICEAYNYRNQLNPRNPYEKKGDRIIILEDTDKDGKADKSTVFYQGEDINAALGISVLGNRVIVSCSPNVFVFTDNDGDDIPDNKEVLFSGIGGEQHDHGMHAFTFGPDGKLYFNYGNAGQGMLAKDGNPLRDDRGQVISGTGKPYREGMVYRCDPDGSNVEILAWNFRNNYEVAVDAYGRMWQSDNDDDGNRGTRINFVMEYGNYGFKDEMTGADWRTRRVNMEDSVFQQHWHLNDPGVVPNLLQTFAGSPTGMTIYEGDLLPQKYRGQILHTDAGPNILRAYPVKENGAGFSAEILNILDGSKRDNWFRPSDVAVAPDGSIFVADWYDPGVGGHAIGDLTKGRVFRIAPRKHKYDITKPDYSNSQQATEALLNPNTATRYNAYMALEKMGNPAIEGLKEVFEKGESRAKSRAFWLLAKMDPIVIQEAAQSPDKNLRIAAIKAARLYGGLSEAFLMPLADDSSAQVQREVALAIHQKNFPQVWLELATNYDGKDRWFLEALGIAADENWDSYLPLLMEKQDSNWTSQKAIQDIVWRSRGRETPALLATLIENSDEQHQLRYYRALDFQSTDQKNDVLLNRLSKTSSLNEKIVIFKQMDLKSGPTFNKFARSAEDLLSEGESPTDFIDIVKKFKLKSQEPRLLELVYNAENGKIVEEAADVYISFFGISKVKQLCLSGDEKDALLSIERFGLVDKGNVTDLLIQIFQNPKNSLTKREMAMEAMNGWKSEAKLWEMIKADAVPQELMGIAKKHMLRTWHADIRGAASKMFGEEEGGEHDISTLLTKNGDAQNGQKVFETYCKACHLVNGEGVDFAPGLSQIGAKLSKEGLYKAILYPSEGMGFGYETQLIKFKNGDEVSCIITSKTENEVNVKLVGQAEQTSYKRKEIAEITQQNVSLMPKFPLNETELVDLVTYMEGLK